MRAVVALTLTLPVIDTLAMRAKVPILLSTGMALTADPPRLVEVDFATTHGMQLIAIVGIMTNQTPQAPLAMLQSHIVHRR